MARDYTTDDFKTALAARRYNLVIAGVAVTIACIVVSASGVASATSATALAFLGGLIPAGCLFVVALVVSNHRWMEKERSRESERRGGKPVLGLPPNRSAFAEALTDAQRRGKAMIDKYLVGFELDSGEPIWVADDEITGHGAVFAKTGVGKTLWLEGLMFQQMARGRASGFTFIDAKRDPGTLADIIMMALITGRIEDLIVVDPFDPVCSYNFVFTTQRADVKARKVLRCGLPPTSDQSTTKHYDRLAADAVYRVVRTMESLGLAWSVRDIAVALSAFTVAYPRMRDLLHEQGDKQAMVELGHLAGSYRTAKGSLDSTRLTDNLRGIASELHSIANSEAGEMFCVPRADLSLTDAILRGKLIYYMLPRLEEAESAARMVKVFREDLEVSIGEVTSSRVHHLEDPHLVIIDEGASTFGPTWANLFELARKGRFALLFGAQSISGLMDASMGLSKEFYDRVIANVNLKVIMRLGDNRTAEDMTEWIGKVNTTKKTISSGVSTSLNAREFTKHIELNKRTADGIREGFTVSEDEKDLVSAEELKHEMSAEKGLAWFDKGDGRLRKGRAIWFDAELPATWEGREYLTRYETVEADEIGLAEWVDEHILSQERSETKKSLESATQQSATPEAAQTAASKSAPEDKKAEEEEDGPFRLNLFKGFRGMGRSRTTTTTSPEPRQKDAAASTENKEGTKSASAQASAAPKKDAKSKPGVKTPSAGRASAPEENKGKDSSASTPPPAKKASSLSFASDKELEQKEKVETRKSLPLELEQEKKQPTAKSEGSGTKKSQPAANSSRGEADNKQPASSSDAGAASSEGANPARKRKRRRRGKKKNGDKLVFDGKAKDTVARVKEGNS